MASKETSGIKIDVQSVYLAEQSEPALGKYLFAYEITISNLRAEAIQLLHRHWIITNALGEVEEVKGPGVVGRQPRIEKGDSFRYNSFCPLTTPFGSMRGSYKFLLDDGNIIEAEIPLFSLVERLTNPSKSQQG